MGSWVGKPAAGNDQALAGAGNREGFETDIRAERAGETCVWRRGRWTVDTGSRVAGWRGITGTQLEGSDAGRM